MRLLHRGGRHQEDFKKRESELRAEISKLEAMTQDGALLPELQALKQEADALRVRVLQC